jgi:hypothetical protein
MTDDEPAVSVFTRDDLKTLDKDPEFDALDNSLEDIPDNFRKPIPEGMTIEQLVEEMEENEDEVECTWCQELHPKEDCKYNENNGWICDDCRDDVVECTWCNELYDKSECRYEVDLGWLCDRCEAAIKSRGETLTFREGSYWDFLDEAVAVPNSTMIGEYVKLLSPFNKEHNTEITINELKRLFKIIRDCSFSQTKTNLIVKFDNYCKIIQETDLGYLVKVPCYFRNPNDRTKILERPEYATCWVSKNIVAPVDIPSKSIDENMDPKKMETLVYDKLTVEVQAGYIPATREEPEEHITKDYTDSFEYSVPANDVATTIFENFLTDDEYYELAESENNDKLAWKNLLDRYDEFVEKHYDELLDYYREAAEEAAKYDFQDRYDDRGFDEGLTKKSMLEELEDPDAYRFRLADCPECGASRSYDHETGICINCGFNFN